MNIPSITEMLEAGVHFGHQVSRWHPKMKPFIYMQRNGIHVVDLEKTRSKMEETLDAVKRMAAEGKQILFISTKPQARDIVRAAAVYCGMPYLVDRWVGGLLTNFPEIKKLLKNFITLKSQQASGELERYTKKEQLDIAKKLEKMDKTLSGLVSLEHIPDAVFIPALQREKTAVTEANQIRVPIVAVVDTNANPDKADYFIPANDDGVKAIQMVVSLVAEAVKEGKKEGEKLREKQKAETAKAIS